VHAQAASSRCLSACGRTPLDDRARPNDDGHVRVLVVEDDRTIADFVAAGLRQEGYAVDVAATGVEGLDLAQAAQYDAAVVDVMLPRLDGLSLVSALRRAGVSTPVLFLSARHTVDDRVKGLQAGGDDYLTKPFAFAELLARLQAITRRSTPAVDAHELSVADLRLDRLTRRVERAGRAIDLRPREYALLEFLMRHAGRVVSKTMIVSHVWNYSFDSGTNAVDVLVYRLRDKIDRHFEPKLIHTVRGVGYVLKVE
jgi:two-component system OmpR family response regulator